MEFLFAGGIASKVEVYYNKSILLQKRGSVVKTKDDVVYWTVWCSLIVLGILFLIWLFPLGQPTVPECWFYRSWHVYCPGCGGTRAVAALLRGQLLQSLYYHPAVLFTVGSVTAYQCSQTIWRLRDRRGWVLRYSDRWLLVLLMLLVLNCTVRNVLWFGFRIPL